MAHAAQDLLWSLAAVLNRFAEKVELELAQMLTRSSTRLNAALEELLDAVGRAGKTVAPQEARPKDRYSRGEPSGVMLRLMRVGQRLPCFVLAAALVAATSACGSQVRSSLAVAPSATSSAAAQAPGGVSVVLLHCGMSPVTVEGRAWKAPPQAVDGDPDLPLDATNRPDDWVGDGTVVVTDDHMTFTDQGGEVVEFVPDDGTPPPGCA